MMLRPSDLGGRTNIVEYSTILWLIGALPGACGPVLVGGASHGVTLPN